MKAAQELRKPERIRKEGDPTESICIAVVEDDMMYRQAIEVTLNKVPGTRILGYDSGEECLRNYHTCKPDIFVLDYSLTTSGGGEAMNGIEVLRKVKQVNNGAAVIFLSNAANTEVAVTAIKAGAIDFIAKDKNGLARLINQVRKASINIQVKRQESRVVKWIGIGALIIAAIICGTILADTEGFNDFWNWFWLLLSLATGVLIIRAWVRNSRHDHEQIQTTQYTQSGKWID